MTMRHLILLGLALTGVVHANEESEEHEEDDEEHVGQESEENEDDVPSEPPSEETVKALFQRIDKDGDGKVAESELLAFALHMRTKRAEESHEQFWEEQDKDRDGKLSLVELSEPDEEYRVRVFKASDADGDGFLNKEESLAFHNLESSPAVEHAVAKFEMKLNDKDGDERLNMDEFAELYGTVDEEDGQEQVQEKQAQEMQEFAMDSFEHLDKNKDGFLDVKEMQAYESGRHHEEQSLTKMAQHADKDGDGFITLLELLQRLHGNAEQGVDEEYFYHLEGWANELEL